MEWGGRALLQNDFKERVRTATDIVEVVSRFTDLKTKGKNLAGLCPLPGHTEKTPSFTVNRDMQYYYCFGCQRGGDVFKFAQEVMGHSFPDALDYFAEKAGISRPPYNPYSQSSIKHPSSANVRQKKTALLKVNLLAKNIFQEALLKAPPDHPVQIYLKKRGFHLESLKTFQIGYAPNDWSFLSKKLSNHRSLARELGLIKQQTSAHAPNQSDFDIYRNRLLFPIITIMDEVVGFGGRTLMESDKEAKYINSPASDIFHKGKILYGLNLAASHIRSFNQVLIVEGYTDVIMLHQNGFKNTVGVLGTAFTEDHARLIKRYTQNVVVLFDSDEAGQKATQRALPVLLETGLSPRSLEMPEGQDPDIALKTWGGIEFQKKLKNAPDLFECLLMRQLKGQSLTPSFKLQVLDEMGPLISKMADQRLKSLYIQTLAQYLRLDVGKIQQYILPQKRGKIKYNYSLGVKTADQEKYDLKRQIIKRQMEEKSVPKAELVVAAIVANNLQKLKLLEEQDILKQFSSEKISCFLKKLQALPRQDSINLDKLLRDSSELKENKGALDINFQTPIGRQLIEYIMFYGSESNSSQIDQFFEDAIRRIKECFLKEQARMAMHQHGNNLKTEDLKHFMDIQKTKHHLT